MPKTLIEQIAEEEKQLGATGADVASAAPESAEQEAAQEEEVAPAIEPPAAAAAPPVAAVKEAKTEAATEQEASVDETKDGAAWARARREKRELLARTRELEEKLTQTSEQLQALTRQAPASAIAKPTAEDNDPEPNKLENLEGWLEWKDRQLERKTAAIEQQVLEISQQVKTGREQVEAQTTVVQAAGEFRQIGEEYAKTNPAYHAAGQHVYQQMADAYLKISPFATREKIEQQVGMQILQFAAVAQRQGHNPAEALYDLAIERYGFTPQAKPDNSKPAQNTSAKPNLQKIDQNRRKAASPLAAGGESSGAVPISLESLDTMSNAEFLKLSPELIRQLESQAGL